MGSLLLASLCNSCLSHTCVQVDSFQAYLLSVCLSIYILVALPFCALELPSPSLSFQHSFYPFPYHAHTISVFFLASSSLYHHLHCFSYQLVSDLIFLCDCTHPAQRPHLCNSHLLFWCLLYPHILLPYIIAGCTAVLYTFPFSLTFSFLSDIKKFITLLIY